MQQGDQKTCVYILKTGKNLFKIGKTRDLQRRLASYHTHLPILFRVVRQYSAANMSELEESLHIVFQHRRVKGEWFLLTNDDLVSALSMVNRLAGEDRYSLHPLTRSFIRKEFLHDAAQLQEKEMQFANFWVAYAKQYGGYAKSYKTYGRLSAEWTNIEAATNILWEMALAKNGSLQNREAAEMLNQLTDVIAHFFLFDTGRWEECLQLTNRSYQVSNVLGNLRQTGQFAFEKSFLHFAWDNLDAAETWAARCSAAWPKTDNKRLYSRALNNSAVIATSRNNFLQAESWFNEILQYLREINDEYNLAITLKDVGDLERRKKNYPAAEGYYREALNIDIRNENLSGQIAVLLRIGKLMFEIDQISKAEDYFNQAFVLSLQHGRIVYIAEIKYRKAQIYEKEGRSKDALPLAQEALEIYERLRMADFKNVQKLVQRLTK